MKDWRNILILLLGIILIYFTFSGRRNATDDVRLDALEKEKAEDKKQLAWWVNKTKSDSLNFTQHLRQDSLNSIDVERLEKSYDKSRRELKEAETRNKVVFSFDQSRIDSAFRILYPNVDPTH